MNGNSDPFLSIFFSSLRRRNVKIFYFSRHKKREDRRMASIFLFYANTWYKQVAKNRNTVLRLSSRKSLPYNILLMAGTISASITS